MTLLPATPNRLSSALFPQHGNAMRIGLGTSREQSFRIKGRIRFRMTNQKTIRERLKVLIHKTFSWLGREDSNLRMAESKSDQFSFLISRHSEKAAKIRSSGINGLSRFQ